jgi:hypothetical protein
LRRAQIEPGHAEAEALEPPSGTTHAISCSSCWITRSRVAACLARAPPAQRARQIGCARPTPSATCAKRWR